MTGADPRILVLGGGGPIGRAMARVGEQLGWSVVVSGRRLRCAIDVSDHAAVTAATAELRPHAVVDLVMPAREQIAQGRTSGALADVGAVVEAAAAAGCRRVVYASTGAVYGDRGERPFREDDPAAGSSDYARFKAAAETALHETGDRVGVSTVALRVFNVFGPGCDQSLINKLRGGQVPALSMSAGFVRDYVHVDDVARALLLACIGDSAAGTMNVATGEPVDNLMLAAAVPADAFHPHPSQVRSYSVGDPRCAEALLGWRAQRRALPALRCSALLDAEDT